MKKSKYLFKRPGSNNWQLELKFPKGFEFEPIYELIFQGRRHFTTTLKTADYDEAQANAAQFISDFHTAIYLWKGKQKREAAQAALYKRLQDSPDAQAATDILREAVKIGAERQITTVKRRRYEDGLQEIDGRNAFVDGDTIRIFDLDGKVLTVEDNPSILKADLSRIDDRRVVEALTARNDDQTILPEKFRPSSNPDDSIIDDYIAGRALTPHVAADTRSTWATYKQVIGKRLVKATRKDGKAFASHLASTGLRRATVQKKVGWLAAAVNHSIDNDGLLSLNPFLRVLPPARPGDSQKRRSLSESHMASCFANLHRLDEGDRLLWLLLAKTGMRLGEAMTIERDFEERGTGIRYVEVGSKTPASRRNVPLPLDIGLPEKITRRLFRSASAPTSKRLNRFIRAALGKEASKELVVHSLRHRAIEVFRTVSNGGDPFLRRRLVGHAAMDVHDIYGSFGPPMGLLLPMIEANPIDGSLKLTL